MNSKDFRGGCSRSIGFDYITFLSGDFTISQLFPLSVGHQDATLFSQEVFFCPTCTVIFRYVILTVLHFGPVGSKIRRG